MAQQHPNSNNEIIAGALLVVGVLVFILSGNAYMTLTSMASNGNNNTVTPYFLQGFGQILFFGIWGSTCFISSVLLFTRNK